MAYASTFRWKSDRDNGNENSEDVEAFLASQIVFASPLTRAIETALLTCQDHPKLTSDGLTLLRNLREVKNFGSVDTVGIYQGDDIANHVKATLMKDMKSVEEAEKALVKIIPNDAIGPWWTDLEATERKEDVKNRSECRFNHGIVFISKKAPFRINPICLGKFSLIIISGILCVSATNFIIKFSLLTWN